MDIGGENDAASFDAGMKATAGCDTGNTGEPGMGDGGEDPRLLGAEEVNLSVFSGSEVIDLPICISS